MDGLTTAHTVTQVQPDMPFSLPASQMHRIIVLQVHQKYLMHRAHCSAAELAA